MAVFYTVKDKLFSLNDILFENISNEIITVICISNVTFYKHTTYHLLHMEATYL